MATQSTPLFAFLNRYRWFLAYFSLIFISLILRLWQLGIIPPAIHHDEIYYAVEAQTIVVAGQDPSGTWRPWELRPAHVLYAELPGTLFSFGSWLSRTPLVAARLSSVIAGLGLSLALAWFSWGLFKKRDLAFITAVLASFNPWIFQFSRMTFDALFSLVFYYLGLAILINTKKWWRITAALPLILGFFQYQGLKIVFLPMLLIALGYVVYQEWPPRREKNAGLLKRFAPVGVLAMVGLVLMVSFVIRLKSQSANARVNDLIFFNDTYVTLRVNDQRRLSITSPLSSLLTNKVTVITWELLYKYVHAFHPILLFVIGEPIRNPFSVWSLGLFHVTDFFLIVFGIAALWQASKWRAQSLFLLGLAVIAPLPLAINTIEAWIIFRASLLFPILVVVAAVGWDFLWSQRRALVKIGLVTIYGTSVLWFGYHYFFRYPIYSTNGRAFAERVMSNYLHRLPPGTKAQVLGDQSEFLFYNFLFHNRLITKENIPAINTSMVSRHFELNNTVFDTRCVSFKGDNSDDVIISDSTNTLCDGEKLASDSALVTNIPSPIDSGTLFRIYNDPLCTKYSLEKFSRIQDIKTLNVEALTDEEFCKRLIIY